GPADRSFAETVIRTVLERRYEPARIHGATVPWNFTFHVRFKAGDSLLESSVKDRLLADAKAGDRAAQFAIGVLGIKDPGGKPPTEYLLASAQGGVPDAQLLVGTTLLRQGDASRATPWLERASRAGLPAAHVRYGLALLAQPQPPYAKVRELLSRAPGAEDRWGARHAIEALACSKEAEVRDPQAALAIAERAGLERDVDPLSREAVAAARATAGDHGGAARAQRRAIEAARVLRWSVDELERRLSDYERGRPCESAFLPEAMHVVPAGGGAAGDPSGTTEAR
ncbi:MAG TPA: hypothetical protein VFK90_10020, partial [Anaeromyxobacter sp.]|nr:hypothetical protein [Anaeromyxobacter sp.]